jgi:prophage DNA circulation protein
LSHCIIYCVFQLFHAGYAPLCIPLRESRISHLREAVIKINRPLHWGFPLVEDFGEKSGEWSLSAYFVGLDYDIPRNEFLRLLNEPGPDWLYPPWLGPLWVRASSGSVSESNDKGGYCAVKVEFVAGGEVAPHPARDLDDMAQAACEEAAVVAAEEFDLQPMSSDALGGFIAGVNQRLEKLRNIVSLVTLPLSMASRLMTAMASVKTEIAALSTLPRAMPMPCLASCTRWGWAWGAGVWSVCGGIAAAGIDAGTISRRVVTEIKPTDRTAIVGRIAKAAGPDRQAVTPDEVFQPLVTVRAAVITALLARDTRPTVRRDIAHPLPSALIAHNLGVDEDVFLLRNAVRHPIFVVGAVYG